LSRSPSLPVAGPSGAVAALALLCGCSGSTGYVVDDVGDDVPGACTEARCAAGSAACCPGAAPGLWDDGTAACVCPGGGDADADSGSDEGPEICGCDGEEDRGAEVDEEGDGGGGEDARREDGRREDGARDDAPSCLSVLGGPCHAVEQCGCRPTERCVLDLDAPAGVVEMCVTAGGNPIDTPCTSGDRCVRQNQCFDDAEGIPVCSQFCLDDDDCPPGRLCGIPIPDVTGYRLCGPAPAGCDPFTADGCDAGEGCSVDPGSGATFCTAAGTGRPGDECVSTLCAAGSGCHVTESEPTPHCYKYCNTDPGGAPDCSDLPGTLCYEFGWENYGLCLAD
jgi:hypothetical protein